MEVAIPTYQELIKILEKSKDEFVLTVGKLVSNTSDYSHCHYKRHVLTVALKLVTDDVCNVHTLNQDACDFIMSICCICATDTHLDKFIGLSKTHGVSRTVGELCVRSPRKEFLYTYITSNEDSDGVANVIANVGNVETSVFYLLTKHKMEVELLKKHAKDARNTEMLAYLEK